MDGDEADVGFGDGLTVLELLLNGRALHQFDVLVDVLDVAELADEVGGGLFADTLDAFDVVAGVALERLEIDHVLRAEAPALGRLRLVVDDDVALVGPEHEDVDVRADELDEVGVERDEVGLDAQFGGLSRDRPGDIVGFVAGGFEDRDVEAFEHFADALHLGQEVGRGLAAGGLVGFAGVVAERFPTGVPGGDDVRGIEDFEDAEEGLGVAVGGVGGLALAAGERVGHRAEREEGPEQDAVGVEDYEAGFAA